jgi:hypothetical protein
MSKIFDPVQIGPHEPPRHGADDTLACSACPPAPEESLGPWHSSPRWPRPTGAGISASGLQGHAGQHLPPGTRSYGLIKSSESRLSQPATSRSGTAR